MPATATYATTGNAYIDGLLGDWKWAIKDFTSVYRPTRIDFHHVEAMACLQIRNSLARHVTVASFDLRNPRQNSRG
jgi:serralysin